MPTRDRTSRAQERRTQEERSKSMRDKIIAATIAVVTESGFANATTTVVAERAGVSRGAIQHHFSSKDDLMSAVVYEITEQVDSHEGFARQAGKSLEERVDYVIDSFWTIYGSEIFISALEIELTARYDDALRTRLSERFRRVGAMRDLEWVHFFSDSQLSPHESVSLRRMMLDALRGLGLRQLISGAESIENEFILLKKLLVATLSRNLKL